MTAARKPSLLACFGILLAVTAGYQWLYCFAATNSDLTGLFFRGTQIPEPPDLEHYGFHYQGSPGYDGQMYRMIAHDPFRKKGYWSYLDDPRLRAGRILIPLTAGLLGGDSIAAVDFWYVAIVDILLALGGVCFVLLAGGARPRLFALALYAMIPAVIASTDRMVLDGPSVAGFLAALVFYEGQYERWKWLPLMGVLVVLPLIRETNLAVTAGFALAYLKHRDVKAAVQIAATAVPGLGWLAYVAFSTPPTTALIHVSVPLLPQVLRLFTVIQRPLPAWQNTMLQASDFISVAALLFTFGLLAAVLWMRFRERSAVTRNEDRPADRALVILPTAIALAFVAGPDVLKDPYGYMRIDSLLITWAALHLLTLKSLTNSRTAEFGAIGFKSPVWPTAYIFASSIGLLIFRGRPIADSLARH